MQTKRIFLFLLSSFLPLAMHAKAPAPAAAVPGNPEVREAVPSTAPTIPNSTPNRVQVPRPSIFTPGGQTVVTAPQNTPGVLPANATPVATPAPVAAPGVAPAAAVPLNPALYLAFDSVAKEYQAKLGESNAIFIFWMTNISKQEVLINSLRPSCGCTTAKLPSYPWALAPGTNGQIEMNVNFMGKQGTLNKTVAMETSVGWQNFLVKVIIPPAAPVAMNNREANQKLAAADRQAVFKNDCVSCHVTPGIGKMGKELYAASCAMCHDGQHRASFVPDLKALKHPTDREHWRRWIALGRVGSLMPAFAQSEGGPLTDDQINSLAEYLTQSIPSAAPSGAPTAANSTTGSAGSGPGR